MSDNKNMKLWQRVCVTDPAHVKPITGKQYKGNSPKPYWIVQRLTEEFGPCGLGWGYSILSERMERLTDTDVLHVAVVRLWYVLDGQRGEVEQIGQTKATYKTKDGGTMVDEDAPKKSVTDALVKCASYIGFAGDIFSGHWDDSKYVEWAREQYSKPETITDQQAAEINALIAQVGADKVAFLAWVAQVSGHEINEVGEIPAPAFKAATKALEKKRAAAPAQKEPA